MMLICKSCKDKFYIPNDNSSLEGKMVKCSKCNAKWIYESKTKYLEDRLSDLFIELDNTENKINLRKKEREDKISILIDDLNSKKEELEQQKNLEEKVRAYENRLKVTEKLNLEELDLAKKAHKIQKEIRSTSANIEAKNNDIEEKTNDLETRINSYNNQEHKNDQDGEVVDIRTGVKKTTDISQDKSINEKKDKKFKFFSPGFIK